MTAHFRHARNERPHGADSCHSGEAQPGCEGREGSGSLVDNVCSDQGWQVPCRIGSPLADADRV